MKRYMVYVTIIMAIFITSIVGESNVAHAGGQMTLYSNVTDTGLFGDKKVIQLGDGTIMVFKTSLTPDKAYEITPQGKVIDRTGWYSQSIHLMGGNSVVPVGSSQFAGVSSSSGEPLVYIYDKDITVRKIIGANGSPTITYNTVLSRANNGGLIISGNGDPVTYSASDLGLSSGTNGWWLDNSLFLTNDAGEPNIVSRTDIANNRYIEYTNKPHKLTVKDTNGVILGFRDITELVKSNWTTVNIFGIGGDKILVMVGNDIYIYQYEEPVKDNDNDNNGGGNSNQITSIIFLAEGSPKPSGFTRVEDEIYKKTTANYEVLMYVVYYKPPATIGNINIQ